MSGSRAEELAVKMSLNQAIHLNEEYNTDLL
jgi:hypothetical protein